MWVRSVSLRRSLGKMIIGRHQFFIHFLPPPFFTNPLPHYALYGRHAFIINGYSVVDVPLEEGAYEREWILNADSLLWYNTAVMPEVQVLNK